jgi:glycosyltransferase involved in cell wall biosynthesis
VAENVLQLALGLGDHGWRPIVAGPETSVIRSPLTAGNVEYVPLAGVARGLSRPDRDLRTVAELTRLLRRRRPALMHCHSSKAGLVGRIAARLAGVPAVYSPHCFGFVGDVPGPQRMLSLSLERALRGSTRTIVCVCDEERGEAVRHGLVGDADARRVYNGVSECDEADQVDADLMAFKGDSLLFGAVTVLREQKRLDLFLRAIPHVLAAVPEARAVVVGDGPLRGELGHLAHDLGLEQSGRFAFVPFTRPSARFLRALDVFVLSSAWEAMPIGLLEAMACGTPQVATAVGGTPEAVTAQTGVLITPNDVDAIASGVIELLGDPARRAAAAEASRRRHAELFTLGRMVRETASVYADVVGLWGTSL